MKPRSTRFDPLLLKRALLPSLKKLDPRVQWRNPVMFTVWLGAVLCTALLFRHHSAFEIQLTAWLWFTLLFANFAEAIAESRGKAQADSLRSMRVTTPARKLDNGKETSVSAEKLVPGDVVVCEAGDVIPADGEVTEGIASVDESAITGESAPVIRESGGDRSAVTGGTRVISDRILVKVTSKPGESFLDRMIALVEGGSRRMTPNEQALGVLLVSLTVVFVLVVFTLPSFTSFLSKQGLGGETPSLFVLIALLVCLIPTTIGGLVSAIGISGIDRLTRRNVLATSGRAVEAAGDIDVLLLDKTGTITLGNRQASHFVPAPGVTEKDLADAAQLASLADETPEGRSIVVLAKNLHQLRGHDLSSANATFVPFTAQTRMSGIDWQGRTIRKGAAEAVRKHVESLGGSFPNEASEEVNLISRAGGTPLVVVDNTKVLGVIHLKDIVKNGIRERFARLREMGIRTVMITGDNPRTAAAIAAEAGVDDFMAEATPEDKLQRIREEQAAGHLVAMTGDGTNDAPALAQADVGVAMNTGTQAAREAGNMVDLDSDPTKLIDIVETGKQLLMTRGSLTTFSLANDVAKYFAILPAMFASIAAVSGTGPLAALDIMGLHSPQSAILSAVIFNALIIIALIPLALKGVSYRPMNAASLLRRNLLIYGLGGLITPFPGIKLIDLILSTLHLV
ncbi:potassium-transporting ATPase subunit KdpB [Luteolibacter pohnpeiensis]|uniref:Potassium-transporting ATPase ATP-binding subunit n=1 Tax=Luteolibacter pohnpeiensis TaxID=454153 RepID=A0A934VWF7_9BACT|nr:potassium-transporting ATPase subunit KdpB [Luteolibacter pohnpeiensis]MBK1884572.1 potassium-transporting ATPase subunit KdpB [Luteolibacter pohnpeiensis]